MNHEMKKGNSEAKQTELVLSVMLFLFVAFLIVFAVVFTAQNYAGEPMTTQSDPPAVTGDSGGTPPADPDVPTFVRDPNKKYIAITYDDGPNNVNTKLIVDELSKYGYHATFFVVGNRVDGTDYNGAAAMKYAVDAGNEIAIHGYTHEVYYDRCTEEEYRNELAYTKEAILEVLPNYSVNLMRPIGGNITSDRVASCPYAVIMWSVDSEDWKHKYDATVDAIVENVMSQVRDGSIVLMHDLYTNTYEATKIILARLHAEGYEVVTVSQLLGNPQPGQKYSRYE